MTPFITKTMKRTNEEDIPKVKANKRTRVAQPELNTSTRLLRSAAKSKGIALDKLGHQKLC